MNLGPAWRLGREQVAYIHQLAPPVASVLAPLPMALIMALINAEPQSAITTLVMLSFPMTLLVSVQFFIARGARLVGWASAATAGAIAGIVMMNVLGMVPPPESLEAMRADEGGGAVGPAGGLGYFIVPGIITALAFWLALRLQCPRAFVEELKNPDASS